MKVLAIPDVHLKTWMFDRAEDILKSGMADMAVCLMDIPDDWDAQFKLDNYRQTFDRAISFTKMYPETLWCYGNHDISYLWGKLETGYSTYAEQIVMDKLAELKASLKDPSQISFVHRIDKVLFSHGGLCTEYVKSLDDELAEKDIDEVIRAVNSASEEQLWNDLSPLWLRPQIYEVNGFRSDSYIQVVGHTPVDKIYEKGGMISTDVFSTYPDGRPIGEPAMIVIDSLSGEYEKIIINKNKTDII